MKRVTGKGECEPGQLVKLKDKRGRRISIIREGHRK